LPRRRAVLWIAASGFCSTFLCSTFLPASGIPYATGTYFADNPIAADVSLPPLPDALRPMGPPKAVPLPRTEPLISPLPNPDSPTGKPKDKEDKGDKDVAANANADGDTPIAPAPPAPAPVEKSVTVSPFNAWISGDKDAASVAQAERAKYQNQGNQGSSTYNGETTAPDDANPDLMLNIRYPYTWNQQPPPSASAVIYTMPKR